MPLRTVVAMAMLTGGALAQEIEFAHPWPNVVKRGDIWMEVRCLGRVTESLNVELQLREVEVNRVRPGMGVSIDTHAGIVKGKVGWLNQADVDGFAFAEVQLEEDLPPEVQRGAAVDGTIEIGILYDVVFVGRPVSAMAESEGTLFKIEPGGDNAVRVKVQYGQGSVNQIEIRSGLQPGDEVILSDTSAFDGWDRVRIK
jgi:multidrug efflux pump subunit AcrA (membrane-fusion protein)